LDALYFMIITSGTIGYGDICPRTLLARSVVVVIILSVFFVFGDNIAKIGQLMKQANFEDKYYHMQDHIVIIGTTKLSEVSRFILTLIDIKTFGGIPNILIIGDQKLKEIDLDRLLKNPLAEIKIRYLSAVDGIDMRTYRKACIENCRAVYFIGHMNVSDSNNAYTQNLLHKMKQVDQYLQQHKMRVKQFKPLCYRKRKGKQPVSYFI